MANSAKVGEEVEQQRVISVSGLVGKCCNEFRLRNYFAPFGPIDTVVLVGGSATIQFQYAADALEAVKNANGAEFQVITPNIPSSSSSGATSTTSILVVRLAKLEDQQNKERGGGRSHRHHQQAVWAKGV